MATGEEKKCFVIGPIGADESPERTDADWLLEEIIKPALENNPFNYDVQRADEIAKPGSITDQIIGAVIEADLVVADLTGANANAFYELAIRHMEQRAVIHMAKKDQPLPFDIRDFRAVFYSLEHPRDLKRAIATLREQVQEVETQRTNQATRSPRPVACLSWREPETPGIKYWRIWWRDNGVWWRDSGEQKRDSKCWNP